MLRSLILYLYIVLIIINNLTNTAKDPFLEVLLPERMYKHYKLNEKTGYLEKLIAPISHLVEMISSDAEDGTTTTTILDALPQSIDQLISPVGHSKLFSGIPVESMPPKHYMHYLWLHETSRPIVLPCWTPYKQEVINWYETNSDMEITRTWFIGQGPSEFWRYVKQYFILLIILFL
ncbi:unnamed protein product [Trichobilharzia regenti]|nr:unnamed protein product [Trichobilharzia regenti]